MKPSPLPSRSGAALLVTLILVSAITLIVISFFAVAREEISLSRSTVATAKVSLGEEAAFAESAALLRSLTANDTYLVTLALRESEGKGPARYTFITTPGPDGIRHQALFSGGKGNDTTIPDFDTLSTTDLVSRSPAPPELSWDDNLPTESLEIPPLVDLGSEGGIVEQSSRPPVHFVEMPTVTGSPYRLRYAYWIEDLEGYPHLDLVTAGTAPRPGTASRFGYGAGDSRTGDKVKRFALEGQSGVFYQFPATVRGQGLVDQIAPGLSTREITLQTWNLAGLSPERHPYHSDHFSHGGFPSDRFSRGLHPYRVVPLVPHGHGYADEGKARHNLNTLVARRDLSLAGIVSRNLPNFIHRKGGFPEDEDYLGTLAANAIDYADADGMPALPDNTTHAGEMIFRGVDAYCPVNEFFVKFEYVGYKASGASDRILFEATPYAEFWNTSNRPVTMAAMRLKFRFLERLRFRANSVWHEFPDTAPVVDEAFPARGGLTLTVMPGQYRVLKFGKIRWEVTIPRPALVAFPVIQDLRGTTNTSVRAHYELHLGKDCVDQSGRPESGENPATPRHGFFFPRHPDVLTPGASVMRLATPGLAGTAYGFNAGYGSHLGDPWMTRYSRSTFEDALYRLKGTPGSRNYDHDKVTTAQPDRFKDQCRVRDWPDRGYDREHGTGTPASDSEPPDSFDPTPRTEHEAFAPWRLSNHGRFYSVTELGHLHDPVMWIPGPASGPDNLLTKQVTQRFSLLREKDLESLPLDAKPGKMWGGGNTLRIGRPEHDLFDRPGMRASQWLDFFHTGHTGTNLGPDGVPLEKLYQHHDPRIHQPLPAAPDPLASATRPYSLVHDPDLHAQGRYRLVHGHLNLNTVPTRFEIETLLRGPSVSSDLRLKADHFSTPLYEREGKSEGGLLRSSLREESIPRIAADLIKARPFYSPSHFARVFSELLARHDALPDHHNDAEAEESFARLHNTTTLSSRHFRIHTYAEAYHGKSGEIVGRARRVREVFLRPIRKSSGEIESVKVEVLSTRAPFPR